MGCRPDPPLWASVALSVNEAESRVSEPFLLDLGFWAFPGLPGWGGGVQTASAVLVVTCPFLAHPQLPPHARVSMSTDSPRDSQVQLEIDFSEIITTLVSGSFWALSGPLP